MAQLHSRNRLLHVGQLVALLLALCQQQQLVVGTPIWGCEQPALPSGSVHVVVSTFNAEADQLLPWLWHLGLTNAHIYIYYRVDDPAIPKRYKSIGTLPCNMKLIPTLLLPNKGREAAAFLQHIITFYDNMPKAMMLVHDHGPASRHSLCGPFYRRVRGYYRGLGELSGKAPVVAAGSGNKQQQRGSSAIFSKFASMAVTLSSGCMENWAKGCCAMYVCSGTVSACPFANDSDSCTTSAGSRKYYLHGGPSLYDSRYENQIVGPNGTSWPVAMVRYASTSSAFARMWNISHEYAPGEIEFSKDQTLAALKDILNKYDFPKKKLTNFKSCCASLIIRDSQVRRWPIELYKEIRAYAMDKRMDYEATKAVSGPGWALWSDKDYTPEDMLLYLKVDLKLQKIQGCPARVPAVQAILRELEAQAAGGGGGSGASGSGKGAGGGASSSSKSARKTRRAAMSSGVSGGAGGRGGGSGQAALPAGSIRGSGSNSQAGQQQPHGDDHDAAAAKTSMVKLTLALAWPVGIFVGFCIATVRSRQQQAAAAAAAATAAHSVQLH